MADASNNIWRARPLQYQNPIKDRRKMELMSVPSREGEMDLVKDMELEGTHRKQKYSLFVYLLLCLLKFEKIRAKAEVDVIGEKVGEWGVGEGEWTDQQRDRKPTEFEKENPNILMLDKDGRFQNM